MFLYSCKIYSPPTLTSVGHRWTASTNTQLQRWLSLAKPTLKVAPPNRNRSPVAPTSKCGWAINLHIPLKQRMMVPEVLNFNWVLSHAPITPNFPFGPSREIAEEYNKKQKMAHHFSHYYSRRCRRMVSELPGVIGPKKLNRFICN